MRIDIEMLRGNNLVNTPPAVFLPMKPIAKPGVEPAFRSRFASRRWPAGQPGIPRVGCAPIKHPGLPTGVLSFDRVQNWTTQIPHSSRRIHRSARAGRLRTKPTTSAAVPAAASGSTCATSPKHLIPPGRLRMFLHGRLSPSDEALCDTFLESSSRFPLAMTREADDESSPDARALSQLLTRFDNPALLPQPKRLPGLWLETRRRRGRSHRRRSSCFHDRALQCHAPGSMKCLYQPLAALHVRRVA